MAAFYGTTQTEAQAIAAGSSTETVLQLVAATNHRVRIIGWGISFDGPDPTEAPLKVVFKRQTSAGTSSAGTVNKVDDSIGDSLQTTSRVSFTVEPTAGAELEAVYVHPQSGYEKLYPEGREIIVGAGDRVGIEVTNPTGNVAVNANAFILFEE